VIDRDRAHLAMAATPRPNGVVLTIDAAMSGD
jgi:hypothetical protein